MLLVKTSKEKTKVETRNLLSHREAIVPFHWLSFPFPALNNWLWSLSGQKSFDLWLLSGFDIAGSIWGSSGAGGALKQDLMLGLIEIITELQLIKLMSLMPLKWTAITYAVQQEFHTVRVAFPDSGEQCRNPVLVKCLLRLFNQTYFC